MFASALGLAMYPALLLGVGVVSLMSMAAADWCGQLPALTGGPPGPRLTAYGALLVIPGRMVLFWLKERYGKVADESSPAG